MSRAIFKHILLLVFLSSCIMNRTPPDLNGLASPLEEPTLASGQQWRDENEHALGICFEAAWDAAGRVFIIRTAEEHIRFYDLADNSHLCRRPVGRVPRDFSTGYVIAGFWSRGIGCKARHEVTGFFRDDDRKTILMQVKFITEGNCNYELVRPFWIGLENAAGHEITFVIENG